MTESLQPKAHGEAIAALLLPYLSPEAHFVLFPHEDEDSDLDPGGSLDSE